MVPVFQWGFFDRPQQDTDILTFNPQANQMALNTACEGIILLKNEQNTLPIHRPKADSCDRTDCQSAIVSDRIYNVNSIVYGGGSSKVHPWYVVSALEGIRQSFRKQPVLYTGRNIQLIQTPLIP